MNPNDITNMDTIRMLEFGLLVACPLPGDPNPEDCQLHDIRLCPVRDRAQWLNELSDEECERYFRAHTQCFAMKASKMGIH